MGHTKDQLRAANAWQNALALSQSKDWSKDDFKAYTNLCKGAGALIMQSGLMPTLAFYATKAYVKSESAAKGKEHRALLEQIMSWIAQKPYEGVDKFQKFMGILATGTDSATYRQHTEEALAYIRWLRQFASALSKGEQSNG